MVRTVTTARRTTQRAHFPAGGGRRRESGVALFGLGAGVTNLTGMNPIRSGLRQLAFGAVAAAITYGIGVAVGGLVA